METAMRVMALDVGEKRVGVAVTDPLGYSVQPVTTLQRRSDEQLLQEIETLIEHYAPTTTVVGLPIGLSGQHTAQTEKIERFTKKLTKRFLKRTQVVSWDERLSTAEAERFLIEEAQLSRAKRRQVIDKMAAVVILRSYLESEGKVL